MNASVQDGDFFAYGTLAIDAVFSAVTGILPNWIPAEAIGFDRKLLIDRSYPGLFHSLGKSVSGRLYLGVEPDALNTIHAFEDEVYDRSRISVIDVEGQPHLATSYLILPARKHLLTTTDWDESKFIAENSREYFADLQAFRERYLANEAAR